MPSYLTKEQLTRLKQSINHLRDLLIIRVLYETGCSLSELINLKKTDIKDNYIVFNNRKSRVSEDLIQLIKQYATRHDSEYLFCSRQSPKITPKRVQQIVSKYLRNFNVELKSPQVLRYTHIVHAVQQNIPFKFIMQQTGLKKTRLSQIISEVSATEKDPYRRMFS